MKKELIFLLSIFFWGYRKTKGFDTVHRGGGAKKFIELYTKSIVVNIVN
jgi:hypothetical protein